MKFVNALLALIIIGLSPSLYAHTHLGSSVPADGAHVREVTQIQLSFSAPVTLTAMKLENEAGTEMALGPIPADPAESHTIAVDEALAPGRYVATWRSVGADSHIVSGEVRFIVID